MEINGKTYRNLESQVAYLTDVWNNQVALNEMGIKVVGHVDTEAEIPEGTYEYGDAYMVGTATPYTMYVWTRADLSHSDDYWFVVGKFPMPGPKGDTGDSLKVTNINTTDTPDSATYDSSKGITADFAHAGITYTDGSVKQTDINITTPLIFNANDFTPVASDGKVTLDLDHTKLATKYLSLLGRTKSTVPVSNYQNIMKWMPVGYYGTNVILSTDDNGAIRCNLIGRTNGSICSTDTITYATKCNTYNTLRILQYSTNIETSTLLHAIFYDRSNPPMNILMTDEEVFNSTTYPNKQGIIHLSNYQCPISGLHEYTYTTQIPGYYIVYKITDESNGQDTSSDLWSMNRSIYKMGTEVQPSEM